MTMEKLMRYVITRTLILALPLLLIPELKAALPVGQAFSLERLQRIDRLMNNYVNEGLFPGMIVTVVLKGQIIYSQNFGYSDVEKKIPLQKDAIIRVYSMTKPITSAAVMTLFEEGRFMLDDPVSRYLPSFKNVKVFKSAKNGNIETEPCVREMTVRDLLRQTCGLGYGWGKDPVSKRYQEANLFDRTNDLEQMVQKLSNLPLYYQPGRDWRYSVAIDVLGRLVEVWSGQSLDEYLKKRIFEPLGMNDTGFFVPQEKRERFTQVYDYTPDKGLTPTGKEAAFGRYTRGGNKLFSGGGGLVSTSSDYLRFAQMLANGGTLDGTRILSPKTVALMRTDALPQGITLPWGKLRGHGYAFAMSVQTDNAYSPSLGSLGDYGWDGAASTYFRIDPQEDLVILLMTHRKPCDDGIQIKLKTLVYQALMQPTVK
jgi:CubicO group peptidase (beta-lactamase class C family)